MKYYSLAFLILNLSCYGQFKAKEFGETKIISKAKVMMTATVRNEDELPLCDNNTFNLAGYISNTDKFVKCDGSSWRAATPGDTSTNFIARAPVRYFEWEDSRAKKRWTLPLPIEVASEDLKAQGCSNGWKIPSKEEILVATHNGLFEGIKAHGGRAFAKAWTADFEEINGVAKRIAIKVVGKDINIPEKNEAGLYCVSIAGN